jgi:RNA polymerase sigma-70 factor (ECF subfamily)
MKIISRLCSSYVLRNRIAESRNRLYKVALAWCGSEMLADDLAQETMTMAIQRCHQLRDQERLNAWLYSILNNVWRQHLRRRRDECEYDDELQQDERDTESTIHSLEIVTRVRCAVAELPVEQRQVIALVDLEGFAHCEVSSILDIPIGTVMSRLHRARKTLQAALEEMGPGMGIQKGRLRRVK